MSVVPADKPLVIRGPYIWKGDDRFLIRGVFYQAYGNILELDRPAKPIADDRLPRLQHDISLFKELGLNTIYAPMVDHAKAQIQAMKMLEEAGIYVLTTISTPHCSINRLRPYDSYNARTMDTFFRTVDVMASCPNTLGILVADMLINDDASLACLPVIAAAVRDLKKYMALKNEETGQRILPIGYGATTIAARDMAILDYLSSGDEGESIDFWTCRGFSWVGPSSMESSGWGDLVDRLRNTRIPIFFSEYGANVKQPRSFDETRALYSPQMTRVMSGGCVYEFWQGANNYGLAKMLSSLEEAALAGRLPPDTPRWQSLTDIKRLEGGEIVERRQTDWGTLFVYKDFMNYKASLDAMKEVPPNTGPVSGTEDIVKRTLAPLQTMYPRAFRGDGRIPESCVEWAGIMSKSVENTASA